MHDAIKQHYLAATERDTTLVCRSIGDSTRVLRNALTDRILELEQDPQLSREELLSLAGSHRWVQAAIAGDPTDGAFAGGLSVALIDDIPSCAELMQRLIAQAQQTLQQRFPGMLTR